MNIYLDMDDVVADWKKYVVDMALEVNNVKLDFKPGELLPNDVWNTIKSDHRMYSKLPLRPGGIDLVNWVSEYCTRNKAGLFFLSAIPHNNDTPWACQDKVLWAKAHFPHIPVFLGPYAHDKWQRCEHADDILIDDRPSNIEEWNKAGGRGYLYTEWPECKVWLEETLGTL